jgi:hypothetical protein
MPPGFTDPEDGMNAGKTLFAQVMEFVPWKTFGRIIAKHRGDSGVRTLGCAGDGVRPLEDFWAHHCRA